MTQPTSVYRYYDKYDVLIYVGITSRGARRNVEHNKAKSWWSYVDHQSIEHFPERDEAHRREASLIQAFRPPFNVQHNSQHIAMVDAYERVLANAALLSEAEIDARLRATGRSINLSVMEHDRGANSLSLRTSASDAGLAIRLEPEGVTRIVCDTQAVGRLNEIVRQGPFVVLNATVRCGLKIESASAKVKRIARKGDAAYALRSIALH